MVWIERLLYKLFSEFEIGGRMWLVIKDLYTGMRPCVFYSGSLSREFDVLQGTGQGRKLAPRDKNMGLLVQFLTTFTSDLICTPQPQCTRTTFLIELHQAVGKLVLEQYDANIWC